jgi:hypothetical protein
MSACPVHPTLENASRSMQRHLNKCKRWGGSYNAQGYPRKKVRGRWKYAHRVAYEEFWGELKPGERVYRRCKDKACVAYYHLTTERPEKGEPHRPGTTKLTPTKVRNIRQAWASADRPTQQQLADRYGVDRTTISLIVRNRSWPNV